MERWKVIYGVAAKGREVWEVLVVEEEWGGRWWVWVV